MAVGRVDGHVVGDAVAKSRVRQRGCGDEPEGCRQRRASECFAPIGGLQQPNVRFGRKVRRKTPIADVERAIRTSAQENVRVKWPVVIGYGKFYRRRKVLAAVR